jgi:hypothetical protein
LVEEMKLHQVRVIPSGGWRGSEPPLAAAGVSCVMRWKVVGAFLATGGRLARPVRRFSC